MSLQLTPEDQQAFLIEKLEEFAERLYRQLRDQARDKSMHVPEETLRALSYKVISNNPDGSVQMALSLTDSGRHVDMRRLNFRGNPITRTDNFILQWAEKRGRSFFRKGVPGYSRGSRIGVDEEKQVQRIASAIIFAKGSQKGRKKRRKKRSWSYNRTVYGNIDRLAETLLRDQADFFLPRLRTDVEQIFKFDGLDLS